jgi:DNA-binding Lrp family transcriptional regulator
MLNACILLKIMPTKAEIIIETVRKIDGVRKAFSTYGRFDVAIFVEVKDYKELREITMNVNSMEGVRSTETLSEA